MTITMLLAAPLLAASSSLAPFEAGASGGLAAMTDVEATWEAPGDYFRGESFTVKFKLEAGESGADIASWLLSAPMRLPWPRRTASCFSRDSSARGQRSERSLS